MNRNRFVGFRRSTRFRAGGSIPEDLCNPGNADPSGWVVDPSGLYPVVTQIGGSSDGGLFVNFGGTSVPLQ